MQQIATHTAGPWRVGADLVRVHTNWRDAGGSCTPENFHRNGYAKTIATVGREDGDWRPIGQQVADARLIAAAPDLLGASELLGSLCAWILHRFGPDSPEGQEAGFRQVKARAALSKATGEQT